VEVIGPFSTASVATTPVAAYGFMPYRGKVLKTISVLKGAITVANASCAISIGGVTPGGSPHLVVQSGSAAGQVNTTVMSNPAIFNEGDAVTITPSGATGSSIGCDFYLMIMPASA
jgi:hypothetical protein